MGDVDEVCGGKLINVTCHSIRGTEEGQPVRRTWKLEHGTKCKIRQLRYELPNVKYSIDWAHYNLFRTLKLWHSPNSSQLKCSKQRRYGWNETCEEWNFFTFLVRCIERLLVRETVQWLYAFVALQFMSPFFCEMAPRHWVIGARSCDTAWLAHLVGSNV